MFGKNLRVNPLASRKRLLLAESELNRAQLAGDLVALSTVLYTLTERAKTLGSLASSAAVLVAGLTALRRSKSTGAPVKPTWRQTLLKGAGLVTTFWLAFRSRGREQMEK